jgi:hypothetical protein
VAEIGSFVIAGIGDGVLMSLFIQHRGGGISDGLVPEYWGSSDG